jgi:hypothetical protein
VLIEHPYSTVYVERKWKELKKKTKALFNPKLHLFKTKATAIGQKEPILPPPHSLHSSVRGRERGVLALQP